MKTHFLIASLGAIALAGCTVVRPVAYQPVVTPTVAVAPATVVVADPAAPARAGEGMSR